MAPTRAIAVTKFGAAAYTGSGAMLAEAIHSVADTANQLLLLLGLRRAAIAASEEHPLGYHRVTFFYGMMVALLLFFVGGLGVGGDGLPMQPTESLRQHGKLYLLEEDTLMHNNFDPDKRMHPVEHSIAIYQRNFAQVVTHGTGVTWLENDIFTESPKILPEARRWHHRFQELGAWMLNLDRCAGRDGRLPG